MELGRYTVRSTWRPVATGDRVLVGAVIDLVEGDRVLVYVGGELLFAFAPYDAFFGAYSIMPDDLEPEVHAPSATRVRRAAKRAG